MKIMTTYITLEPTDKMTQRKFKRVGVMNTKGIMYIDVVVNHFMNRHQVGDNNRRRHAPIFIERTCATKYWPGSCFDCYLSVS